MYTISFSNEIVPIQMKKQFKNLNWINNIQTIKKEKKQIFTIHYWKGDKNLS